MTRVGSQRHSKKKKKRKKKKKKISLYFTRSADMTYLVNKKNMSLYKHIVFDLMQM